jgi:hypothetical protein
MAVGGSLTFSQTAIAVYQSVTHFSIARYCGYSTYHLPVISYSFQLHAKHNDGSSAWCQFSGNLPVSSIFTGEWEITRSNGISNHTVKSDTISPLQSVIHVREVDYFVLPRLEFTPVNYISFILLVLSGLGSWSKNYWADREKVWFFLNLTFSAVWNFKFRHMFCRNKKCCSVISRFPVHLPLYKFWAILALYRFLGDFNETFRLLFFHAHLQMCHVSLKNIQK